MVDFRINRTPQIGAIRKMKLPFFCLVGAVSNCADAVRGKTAPTGWRKCFFIFSIHYKWLKSRKLNSPITLQKGLAFQTKLVYAKKKS